jgi:hypothetical protein
MSTEISDLLERAVPAVTGLVAGRFAQLLALTGRDPVRRPA